ncbi:hypothetical protein KC573_02780, partial [candidate division WWE3 bacterium]|nr:hypothetical protein [candidate division WWE3 bacterium]
MTSSKGLPFQKTIKQLRAKATHNLAMHHPHAWHVIKQEEASLDHFVHETEEMAAASALTGALLIGGVSADSVVQAQIIPPENTPITENITIEKPSMPIHATLSQTLRRTVPATPQKMDIQTAAIVSQKIKSITKITVSSELDGMTLNTDYGYMGAEQHLPRFPGDTVADHESYKASGITPKTGAFGYFADTQDSLTKEMIEQEKYYMAVQSFLSPQWDGSGMHYKDWIQYRKVLVINPINGKGVVAVVGDAGPATWTEKQ